MTRFLTAFPTGLMMRRPFGFIEPCQPSAAHRPPSGPGWIHEIKHDGYRMMALRAGDRIRLLTRSRADWSERFPAVVKALEWLDVKSCLIDGELVVCDENGLTVFELLRRGQLYALGCQRAATRESPGTTSRSNCRRLATSSGPRNHIPARWGLCRSLAWPGAPLSY
jgi:hypothetical protein